MANLLVALERLLSSLNNVVAQIVDMLTLLRELTSAPKPTTS